MWSLLSLMVTTSFIFLTSRIHCLQGKQDFYTSTEAFKKLIHLEKKIVALLESYHNATFSDNKSIFVSMYLEEYKKDVKSTGNGHKIILYKNPLLSFKIIRRMFYDLKMIEESIPVEEKNGKRYHQQLRDLKAHAKFPEVTDLYGAMEALIRLQDAYNLDVNEFSRGKLINIETKAELKGWDSYLIGLHCLRASIFTRAIQWLEVAQETIETENSSGSVAVVSAALEQAIHQHNTLLSAGHSTSPYLFTHAVEAHKNVKNRTRSLDGHDMKLYYTENSQMDLLNFAALCRESRVKPLYEKMPRRNGRFCKFDVPNSYHVISPLKTEILHKNPLIVQVYDVLSRSAIKEIIKLAGPSMERSQVIEVADKAVSSTRTSSSTWIHEEAAVSRVSYSLAEIMERDGNRTGTFKMLQVASYGLGGHYNPHLDTADATVMFYLTDVDLGGFTVFPRLGVRAVPIRGSAVFWFNRKLNGDADPLTLHGGCPVLLGSKWVANKWMSSETTSSLIDKQN